MNKHGILPVNKAAGTPSFHLVTLLRRRLQVRTIGHAGTLDPFATGVMVLFVDRLFTRLSGQLLSSDKEYRATLQLGRSTDTFDCDGAVTAESGQIPTQEEVTRVLQEFDGEVMQVPPMFSAKKIAGKRCYELARKGITVERKPVKVQISNLLLSYSYPYIELTISCSKGTYIRSLAHDIGQRLGCGAFLAALTRMRVGPFHLRDCVDQERLSDSAFNLTPFFRMSL
jgi:tRNA pseudouridine55 synthase